MGIANVDPWAEIGHVGRERGATSEEFRNDFRELPATQVSFVSVVQHFRRWVLCFSGHVGEGYGSWLRGMHGPEFGLVQVCRAVFKVYFEFVVS